VEITFNRKTITIGLFTIIVLLVFRPYVQYITYVLIGNLRVSIDEGTNKQKLIKYLKENYDENLEIVEFQGGNWSTWTGRKADSIIVKSKDYDNYLFEVKIHPTSEKTIEDQRNSFHYGYFLKRKAEEHVISRNVRENLISLVTIEGNSVNEVHYETEKNKIDSALKVLAADVNNKITYRVMINHDKFLNKNDYINQTYSIYEYLLKTKCKIFLSIEVVNTDLYTTAKDNLEKKIYPLGISDREEDIYKNVLIETKGNGSDNRYAEENSDYLSKEEFTKLFD
jgi:hypothetical protein